MSAVNVTAAWDDDRLGSGLMDWARATHATLSAGAPKGAYSNFAGQEAVSLADIYGQEALARLMSVKRRYDPQDVFQPAVHIRPGEDTPC